MQTYPLDALPIWTLLPLTLIIGLLSVEIGCRIARDRKRRANERTEAPSAPVVAASLGLLAFLLAFTFGAAASRFEERRQAVLAETNAISTSYLRAQLLPEPMASDTRNLLRQYVDVRLEGAQPDKFQQAIVKSEELHQKLWNAAVAAAQKQPSPMVSLFMQSLNEVFNLHAKRVTAAQYNRVPLAIWTGLYVVFILGLVVMGYYQGMGGTRRSLDVFVLVIAFSTVLVLIADLDRPGKGLLQVNQQSMVDLKKSMSATQ
jgi:hypothetical protein